MTDITEGMIPCVKFPRLMVDQEKVTSLLVFGDNLTLFYSGLLPIAFAEVKDFEIGWYHPEKKEIILCGDFQNGQRSFGIDGVNREDYFDKFVINYLSYHYKDPATFISWNELEALYKNQFRELAVALAETSPAPNP